MKRFLSLLAVILFGAVLVACGPDGGKIIDLNNPLLEMEDYTKLEADITFWHAMGQANQEIIAELITLFQKTYPNINITQSNQGSYDDLEQKIMLSFKTNSGPTIAQTYPDHVTEYLNAKGIKSLEEFINNPKVGLSAAQINDYVPSYYEEGRMYDAQKTLYSLPFNKSSEVLFINASWFESNGLLTKYNLGEIKEVSYGEGSSTVTVKEFVPTPNAHLTWQDIEEICAYYVESPEYQNLTIEEKAFHAGMGIDSEANFSITMIQQFGGVYTSFDNNGKGVMNFLTDPKAYQAFDWFLTLHDKGYIGISSKFGTDYCSDAFKAQQIKLTTGSSAGAKYNEPNKTDGEYDFIYGVLPYPQQASSYDASGNPIYDKQEVIQQGTNLSLMKCKTSEEEMAGWLFLSFISNDPEAQYIWSKGSGYIPAVKSVWDNPLYLEWLSGVTYAESDPTTPIYSGPTIGAKTIIVANIQSPAYYTSVVFKGTSKARKELAIIIDNITNGGLTIAEALNIAKDEIALSMR